MGDDPKAGLARARAQGKRLGRPGIDDALKAKIMKRIAAGATPYRVAKDLGIDRHTAAKYGARPFREAGKAAAAQVI
jgi:DNA invertase Pin-like site-specific DNA recombinase